MSISAILLLLPFELAHAVEQARELANHHEVARPGAVLLSGIRAGVGAPLRERLHDLAAGRDRDPVAKGDVAVDLRVAVDHAMTADLRAAGDARARGDRGVRADAYVVADLNVV